MSTGDELRLLESNVRALKELVSSRGWALVEEAINKDVLDAAFGLADSVSMSTSEVDYRRGAIGCARNMLVLVQRLIAVNENALLMASAEAAAATPKAATAAKEM